MKLNLSYNKHFVIIGIVDMNGFADIINNLFLLAVRCNIGLEEIEATSCFIILLTLKY